MPRTPKLNDLQLVLLTSAAQRPDGSLLPAPDSVADDGARVLKAVASLIKRGLADEQPTSDSAAAWRGETDAPLAAIIGTAGRAAIGLSELEPNAGASSEHVAPADPASPPTPAHPRSGSKQAAVVDLLQQPSGATLADLVAATGWLPHTTRAALTGLRKRGYAIVTDKASGTTRYRIEPTA